MGIGRKPVPPRFEFRGDHCVMFVNLKGSVYETKVDVEDADRLVSFGISWTAQLKNSGRIIVSAKINGKTTKLHRWLLGLDCGVIDHINRDPLDNRKANLRITDQSVNILNSNKSNDSLLGIRGIWKTKNGKRWTARITPRGVRQERIFDTLEEAVDWRRSVLEELGVFTGDTR